MEQPTDNNIEGDINIETVTKFATQIEVALNKSVKGGIFDMREAHAICEYFAALQQVIKKCDALQKEVKSMKTEKSFLKQSNEIKSV